MNKKKKERDKKEQEQYASPIAHLIQFNIILLFILFAYYEMKKWKLLPLRELHAFERYDKK